MSGQEEPLKFAVTRAPSPATAGDGGRAPAPDPVRSRPATTHTEVYRAFEGELRSHPLRFWPITVSGIRAAGRRKIPLLLFYLPPGIATITSCFLVYYKYAAIAEEAAGLSLAQRMRALASNLVEVRNLVAELNVDMKFFSLLAIAWYGAGLFAEDRRVGAHQLYFSRPLTRLDYFIGKFMVAGFHGALASLAPVLVICTIAAYSSPDWSFVRDEPEVILGSVLFALCWIATVTSIVLAFSSLTDRRSYALAGIFGFFLLPLGIGQALEEVFDDDRYLLLSPVIDFRILADWLLERSRPLMPEYVGEAGLIVAGLVAFSLAVVWFRLRRMEAVG